MKLLFTGEFLSAERALELGCVDAVVAPEALHKEGVASFLEPRPAVFQGR